MNGLDQLDLAKVLPCQVCGTPTRMMGSVPISGTGLDLHFADATTCGTCLQAKTDAAVEGIDPEAIARGCIVDRSRMEPREPAETDHLRYAYDGRLL